MKWLTTILIFVCLGNSRGYVLDNPMLLAYQDDLPDLSLMSDSLSNDVSDKVFFYLFTREQPNRQQELVLNDPDSLESSFFNPRNPTKFIIHGFRDSSKDKKSNLLKDRLLEREKVNVILVDWGKIAQGIDYFGIARQTVDVGDYLGEFMNFLVEYGAQMDDFHLIGHSLGAHVAGFAGAAVNGSVARITGLDPALPGFSGYPAEKRLDRSNAKFVDCIHTCAGSLGFSIAICTADFYPNGGKNVQPGCPIFDFGKCSHFRSFDFFIESTNPTHHFPTERCPSPPVNSHQKCKPSSVEMGYYVSTSTEGIFYGETNRNFPFGMTD